jgi:hypothetical protein
MGGAGRPSRRWIGRPVPRFVAAASLSASLWAGLAFGAAPVDAENERPAGGATPNADSWPVAVVDRPQTLRRGMVSASLGSQSYWSPSLHQRSYFGPTAALALHDRVELQGGLPFALCWDAGSNTCAGSSAVDRAFVGLAVGIHRSGTSDLTTGVVASIERLRAPAEHRTAVWFTGKRTWFHRLALLGTARLDVGWEHREIVPVIVGAQPAQQTNQTRIYWTEQVVWQVVEPLALFAYFTPYRPLGAPGDESWAMRVGGGATLALGPRWLFAADCSVENIEPVRAWQYVPRAKSCGVSASVYYLPR